MNKKTQRIRDYLLAMLEDMDGWGLVLTDEDLINEVLDKMGDFTVLQRICGDTESTDE